MCIDYYFFKQVFSAESINKNIFERKFNIAGINLLCRGDSLCLSNNVNSFFSGFSPAHISSEVNICIDFLVYKNSAVFIKKLFSDKEFQWKLLKEIEDGMTKIYVSESDSELILYKTKNLITISDNVSNRGFCLVPEEYLGKISLDVIVFQFLISSLFWQHDLFFLHSSCVCDEYGSGILITGQSGCGKTTLALALMNEGYKFVSNDYTFLQKIGDSIKVYGFPEKRIKIRKNILQIFPRLNNYIESWLDDDCAYLDAGSLLGSDVKTFCYMKIIALPQGHISDADMQYSCYLSRFAEVSSLFIPRVAAVVNEKIKFAASLYRASEHFYYDLPRDIQLTEKNIKKVIAYIKNEVSIKKQIDTKNYENEFECKK